MVQNREPDPFEALVSQGVTAAGPDPSAEPTALIEIPAPEKEEEEVTWLPPREEAPSEPVTLPAPWWKSRYVLAGAVAAVVAVLVAIAWPSTVVIPAPPQIVVMQAPVAVPVVVEAQPTHDDEPVPLPAAPKKKAAARAKVGGFAAWPGDKSSAAQAPPKDGEPLKRPSF